MTELEFIFRAICKRRGVSLANYESVALTTNVTFGLANDTYILPVVANTFYYIEKLNMENTIVAITGMAILRVSNIGGAGSAGDVGLVISGAQGALKVYRGLEADSMRYQVSTHTAGGVNLFGTVFKITTA